MGPTPTPNGNDKAVVPKPNCGMLLLSSSSSCSFLLTHAKKPLLDHIHCSLLRFWHAFASQYSKPLHQFQTLCRQQLIRCTSSRNNNNNKEKWLSNAGFAAVLPGDSVAGLVVANGISNFLNLYNTVLIVRLVLTWFPNAPPAIVAPLSTVCDPYLNIFRGLIPPLGGTLDLSPILAFLVLNAFTSTAAALPAELPTVAESHLTASRKKWMTRLQGSHSTTTTTTATKSSAQDY